MKYATIWVSALLFALAACKNDEAVEPVQDPDLYYWSDSTKHFLSVDPNTIIIRSSLDTAQIHQRVNASLGKSVTVRTTSVADWYIIQQSSSLASSVQKIKEVTEATETADSYLIGKTSPLVPTGEIVLKIRSGYSIEGLLAKFDNPAVISKTKNLGKYTLQPNHFQEALKIANQFYESGFVDFSTRVFS
ncbi:hypothetical protein SAMN05216436_11178 [bacterium A37T11]|nr:hypothetical protein SAMN05216436_11178 [bacterium A37T11]